MATTPPTAAPTAAPTTRALSLFPEDLDCVLPAPDPVGGTPSPWVLPDGPAGTVACVAGGGGDMPLSRRGGGASLAVGGSVTPSPGAGGLEGGVKEVSGLGGAP